MKGNYIYNIIYRLSICILPLIITPFSARVLGADGVGLYSLSSAVACYFIMFGKLPFVRMIRKSCAAPSGVFTVCSA